LAALSTDHLVAAIGAFFSIVVVLKRSDDSVVDNGDEKSFIIFE
jgi:hypothetical protein